MASHNIVLQVDLKCITPAEGGYYYPEHLPVLGMDGFVVPKIICYHDNAVCDQLCNNPPCLQANFGPFKTYNDTIPYSELEIVAVLEMALTFG